MLSPYPIIPQSPCPCNSSLERIHRTYVAKLRPMSVSPSNRTVILCMQVSALMKELAVPDNNKCMASKAAVDLHDHLKRDMMTLFSLEKVLQKKVRSARFSPRCDNR